MANIYDMSDTWNDGATTFTSIKMNVTDTASSASSLLMDLQVGGSSKFSIHKDGRFGALPLAGSPSFLFSAGKVSFRFYGNERVVITDGRVVVPSNGKFEFTSTTNEAGTTADTILARDAANTLAQRNGVNAQTFNLYNTYTDASNYERVGFKWSSNVFAIDMAPSGTGTRRRVSMTGGADILLSPYPANVMLINSSETRLASPTVLGWSASSNVVSAAQDVGIKRVAAGQLQITDGSTGVGSLVIDGLTFASAINCSGGDVILNRVGSSVARLGASSASFSNSIALSSTYNVSSPDLKLEREAAGIFAQRNSTNAQTFNIYNTYTDASNYERGFMKWNSNVLEIGTEAAGTGSGRDVLIRRNGLKAFELQPGYFGFYNSAGTRTMLINSTVGQFTILTSGRYGFGTADTVDAHIYRPAAAVVGIGGAANAGGAAEFKEIASAPAAATDAVRIYAEDDGAGKTRLMALFPTGAAQQIAIEP